MGDAASLSSLAGRRILVVEDDYMLATEVAQALKRQGAEVIGPVPSVEAAMQLIWIAPAIDGALLDVNLQGEMAFPIADMLLKHGVPFAFATGYSESAIPACYAGVSRFEKPLDLARVTKALLA